VIRAGAAVRRRRAAALACLLLVASGCAAAPGSSQLASEPAASPIASAVPDAYFTREQGPPPGPDKPFRGDMRQQVRIVDGYLSMYFELDNTGSEPVTFLNTLYDYEPDQLYTPAVRLEWQEGGNAVYTRSGRFFPSPAILQPGEVGIYLMGGRPVQGQGTPGDLVTHIKYCPTRGMDDVPSQPVQVDDLAWSTSDGITTVSGTLTQLDGPTRPATPTVGVAFFDGTGEFVGAVVEVSVGGALETGQARRFEISGRGVMADQVATARAWAWVD
jgi:hypothetical protein